MPYGFAHVAPMKILHSHVEGEVKCGSSRRTHATKVHGMQDEVKADMVTQNCTNTWGQIHALWA